MTTKTVAVQLVALTNQYKASMGQATASTTKLQTAATGAASGIGTVLGPAIATGAVVAAGAIVKLGIDFEDSFTKISAITDSSQAQVAQWKDQVLALAGETAQAPQELADALYFLASAGLDAADIMPTLEMSAKAAAVGLGDAGDIARLTANAMNAYQASGLKAAEVTDILVAAVREGTAEPDEFADAMGRILPIAAKAGISFDQVAASLASLSNAGLDVDEGVTAMRGVMISLLAPGKQAADTLDQLGLSADDVRRSLAEDGLIATLRLLEERTGGNIDTLRKIIPNVRAMAGAFNLTGQEAAKVDEIFADVLNSSGDLGKSFKKTADSDGFRMRKALNDLRVEATSLGESALPVLASAITLIGDVIEPVLYDLRLLVDGLADLAHGDLPGAAARGRGFNYMLDQMKQAFIDGRMTADELAAKIRQVGRDIGYTAEENAILNHFLEQLEGNTQKAGIAAAGFSGNLGNMVAPQAEDTGKAIEGFGEKTKGAAAEMDAAEKKANDFELALKSLAGIALDAEDAAVGWNQAIADMNEELRTGTKTLDITSQAGRDNRNAFREAAEAAIDHGQAVATQSGSVEKGVRVVATHIEELRKQAIQAGFTSEEIDAYIRHLKLTPKEIRTLIKLDKAKAQDDISAFIGALDRVPDIKDVLIRVKSTGYGTGQQIGHAGGVVGKLPRYHGGGDVKSDEQLILARRGETIRTVAQEKALQKALAGIGTGDVGPVTNTIIVKVGEYEVRRIVVDALNGAVARR